MISELFRIRDLYVKNWAIVTCIVLVTIYCIMSFIVRPSVFSDPGWGLLTWRSFLNGGAFNYTTTPDQSDLLRNSSSFLTAWSPGQYVLPGIFGFILGNIGRGIEATIILSSVIGIVGFYIFYRIIGFDKNISSMSCFIIATSRFYLIPFGEYNGGEIILFGVAPWCCAALYFSRKNLLAFNFLALATLIFCAFVKLTGLILILSVLSGILLLCAREDSRRRFSLRLCAVAVICGSFGGLFYHFWLSQGWTAAAVSENGPQVARLATHVVPTAAALVFSAFSVGDLINRVFLFPGRALVTQPGEVYVLLVPVAALVLWSTWRVLYNIKNNFVIFSFFSAAVYFSVMAILYIRSDALDVNDRHFRFISLILLPGILYSILSWRDRCLIFLRTGFLVCVIGYGLASSIPRFLENMGWPLGLAGFREAIMDREALSYFQQQARLVSNNPDAVILVPSPEIAWETPLKARIIANHADFESIEILSARRYRGRPSVVFLALQDRVVTQGKGRAILGSFSDIKASEWTENRVGSFDFFRFSNGGPGSKS